MGCTTSRLDHLPAVSLCHDRCKFLEEALRQSYAFADAHVAYMNSLNSLGPTLRRFFDQKSAGAVSHSHSPRPNTVTTNVKPNPNLTQSSSSSSPDPGPSSSDSESSHINFRSEADSEDDEDLVHKDFDLLNRIHPNYFNHQTVNPSQLDSSSYYYYSNDSETTSYSGFGNYSATWKTPSPPAPRSSSWDFLNLFESYDRYELFKLDKEANKDNKNDKSGRKYEKLTAEKGTGKQEKVDVVNTNAVSENESTKDQKNESVEAADNRSVGEIMKEVEVLFGRAAESGNEVLKFLDAGKFRYYHKNSLYQGTSSAEKGNSAYEEFNDDLGVISVSLSSTIKKLCIWEKKLYNEVKAEEKLRRIYARYCQQMRSLGEKGAKADKFDSTQTLVRTVATKIKVAIQVIDRISVSISKLRDEELWPQIVELIQKLLEMWKAMLECHRCQSKAVEEARNLDAIASIGKFSDANYLELAIQLKIEIHNWNLSFSNWIAAQRGYVKALNGWLLKCLPHEPEAKPDSLSPFSPGRIGAPPVFVFCNQWSSAIDRISEMELIDNMYGFFVSLNQIMEQHYVYLQQRATADKEIVKKIKTFEREEQRMQKVIQTRDKKVLLGKEYVSVQGSGRTNNASLHLDLKQIFMAIDRFSTNTVQAYEELHVHIEEGRLTKENPEVP